MNIPPDASVVIDYPIGKYTVKVILSQTNEFRGISAVTLSAGLSIAPSIHKDESMAAHREQLRGGEIGISEVS